MKRQKSWLLAFTVSVFTGLPLVKCSFKSGFPVSQKECELKSGGSLSGSSYGNHPSSTTPVKFAQMESSLADLKEQQSQFMSTRNKIESDTQRFSAKSPIPGRVQGRFDGGPGLKAIFAASGEEPTVAPHDPRIEHNAIEDISHRTRAYQALREGKLQVAQQEVLLARKAQEEAHQLQLDILNKKRYPPNPYLTSKYKLMRETLEKVIENYNALPAYQEVTSALQQLHGDRIQLESGWKAEPTRLAWAGRKLKEIGEKFTGPEDETDLQLKNGAVIWATAARSHEFTANKALEDGQLMEAWKHWRASREAQMIAKLARQTWIRDGRGHASSSLTEDGMYLMDEGNIPSQILKTGPI